MRERKIPKTFVFKNQLMKNEINLTFNKIEINESNKQTKTFLNLFQMILIMIGCAHEKTICSL